MNRQLRQVVETAAQRSGPRVSVDTEVMAGRPCVSGTRIPVQTVLSRLANDLPSDASLKEHPEIAGDDVRACLSYAYELLDLVGDATQASEDSGCNAGGTGWTTIAGEGQ